MMALHTGTARWLRMLSIGLECPDASFAILADHEPMRLCSGFPAILVVRMGPVCNAPAALGSCLPSPRLPHIRRRFQVLFPKIGRWTRHREDGPDAPCSRAMSDQTSEGPRVEARKV
jgi:hypothetical protein